MGDRLQPAAGLQLAEDVVQVCFDGTGCDVKRFGDVTVGSSSGQFAEHIHLPPGEGLEGDSRHLRARGWPVRLRLICAA